MVHVLAVIAALIVGIGTVIEQRAASQAPPEFNLSLRLLLYLVQQPLWLAGVACSLVGNLVFAAALGAGAVAVVTAVFVSRLLFALALAAAWGRRRVPGRDLLGAVAVVGGLTGFLLAAQPEEPPGAPVTLLAWLVGGGSVVVFALVLTAVARQLGPARKALLLGTAAGALFGVQASLMSTAVDVLTGPGILALATSWRGYTVVAVALLGMLLVQSAYEAAPLPASYPAIVTTELLAGIAIGVLLLGGTIHLGPAMLAGAAVSLAVMVVGIWLLTTSPIITGQLDDLVRTQDVGAARQVEDRLDRELAHLDRELRQTSRGEPAPRRLRRELSRIDARLDRLAQLQDDIVAHRRAEREQLQKSSGAERTRLVERDRDLREQERAVDERARELRERADTLLATVRSTGGAGHGTGDGASDG